MSKIEFGKSPLLEAIDRNDFIIAPGIQDGIAATIANQIGFEFVYASGYWTAASGYGLPDAGLTTLSQSLDRIRMLVRACDAFVIADADTGFGGLLNVHQTVQEYQLAGVAAIQIEDQTFPKKCGHTATTEVVEIEDMLDRIHVAVEARTGESMAVIARTDARRSRGLREAILRGQKLAEAGADIVFVEALQTEDEMRTACQEIDKPMIANMATGGKSPILTAPQLEALGYSAAIFPGSTSLAAAAAMELVLKSLKQSGDSEPKDVPIYSFERFCENIGFPDVWAFEEKWTAR